MLTLSPFDMEVEQKTKIDEIIKSKQVAVIHKHITFDELIQLIDNELDDNRDSEFYEILNDFEQYCSECYLLNNADNVLRVVPAGVSYEDNIKYNLLSKNYIYKLDADILDYIFTILTVYKSDEKRKEYLLKTCLSEDIINLLLNLSFSNFIFPFIFLYNGLFNIALAVVVFPEPFGPIITCTSPLLIFRLIPFKISLSPSVVPTYKSVISNNSLLI